MYRIFFSKKYKKSLKKLIRSQSGLMKEVNEAINILARGERLADRYQDHLLTGKFEGFRDCHIRPDVILIYQIQEKNLILIAYNIGSHSELF